MERADAAVVTSSGMAAELVAALVTCQAGDELVSMLDVYGGTLKMFQQVLSRCGIKTVFVPFDELKYVERYFTPKTRMLFLETPTNPTLRCVDLPEIARQGSQSGRSAWLPTIPSRRQSPEAAGTWGRHRGPFRH